MGQRDCFLSGSGCAAAEGPLPWRRAFLGLELPLGGATAPDVSGGPPSSDTESDRPSPAQRKRKAQQSGRRCTLR